MIWNCCNVLFFRFCIWNNFSAAALAAPERKVIVMTYNACWKAQSNPALDAYGDTRLDNIQDVEEKFVFTEMFFWIRVSYCSKFQNFASQIISCCRNLHLRLFGSTAAKMSLTSALFKKQRVVCIGACDDADDTQARGSDIRSSTSRSMCLYESLSQTASSLILLRTAKRMMMLGKAHS